MKDLALSRRGLLAAGLATGAASVAAAADSPVGKGPRTVRVLSIDGGGMRGVVPATFIDALETMSGKPITELFDLFVGSSTGALLALGLNVPDANGRPKYAAKDIIKLYDDSGPIIFNKRKGLLEWTAGITKPTYDPTGFEALLTRYFGDVTIADAIRHVAVPAIHLEEMNMEIFTRRAAQKSPDYNFTMRSLVRAATAAPTFFPAASISSTNGARMGTYLDAATSTNNPAVIGLAESGVVYKDDRVVMVSLGTGSISKPIDAMRAKNWGEIEWVQAVFDLQNDAQSSYTERVLKDFLLDAERDMFFRFQIGLRDIPVAMDETRKDHLDFLKETSALEIKRRLPEVRQLLDRLMV
ncbi:MAG: Patatin [Hyphomicrobiales bacterium]|nr:Patatin [Hyphomicrobiales bacterium]